LTCQGRHEPGDGRRLGPSVLMLGGTGFFAVPAIRRLLEDGVWVLVLVRAASTLAQLLLRLGVELAKGDIANTVTGEATMVGIRHDYHLTRAFWPACDDTSRSCIGGHDQRAELP
jgi:uncharacterized protein YbjT (DUF2867 family)